MSVRHNLHNEVIRKTSKKGKWTSDEDEALNELVILYGTKSWKKISENINGRSAIQCLHRWTKILQPGLVKGPWTIEEDRRLKEWVSREGPNRWSSCAEYIKGRNGKQCRERWLNILNPDIKKGDWDVEEDFKLFCLFKKFGSKWTSFSNYFKARTENSIKNRFYSTLRKIYTEKKKEMFPFGNNKMTPTMSTSLDDLIKYYDFAYNSLKVKLIKINNFSFEQINKFENELMGNISEPVYQKPEFENFISEEKTIDSPIIESDNSLRRIDIFSLENQIVDMCDNTSLFFNNEENCQLDNFIENIFANNNIVVNDKDCNLCEQKPETKENKNMLQSLFKQLNDIEQAVQLTKQELMRMENKKVDPVSTIDEIFSFNYGS
jgi:hypothetical protein